MDKEHKAIERIRMASDIAIKEYGSPLTCTYSGGKDSDVLLELFLRSGVPFVAQNSHTTVDAPETVRHIRETFHRIEGRARCVTDYHEYIENGQKKRTTMWSLIAKHKMPPTRTVRYCCSELKESSTKNLMIATGVRWSESAKRQDRDVFEVLKKKKSDRIGVSDEKMLLTDNDAARRLMEHCRMKGSVVVNPIIDWTDDEIWDFYWNECPEHNVLYEMGYYRVGCIGCPMAGRKQQMREFADFPKYKKMYLMAFRKMLENLDKEEFTVNWHSAQDVFDWWTQNPEIPGQLELEFGE